MPVLQEVDQQKLFSGLIPSHTHRTLPVHMRTLSKNAQAANKLERKHSYIVVHYLLFVVHVERDLRARGISDNIAKLTNELVSKIA